MEWLVIIILIIALLVARDVYRRRKYEKLCRTREVSLIALNLQKVLKKITSLKTTGAKVNNCGKAIELFKQAEEYEECREVITNFDSLKSRIQKIQTVLPVIDYIEKAYKHQFKGKDKAELNSLLDALYEIRVKGITNEDILEAEVFPESTGEILTIEGIQKRLSELGWEEK